VNKDLSHDLDYLEDYIAKWRESKGFYTPSKMDETQITLTMADALLGKLMLVVTEVAEAAEAVRHHDKENFIEEIADVFIRLLDICGSMNIDISDAIYEKMCKNEKRPIRHGKKTAV